MKTEVQERADFSRIRYAQCWEDADLLVAALQPEGRTCLSIGSAGDNSFALLAAGARHVHVAEMNPAQVACIELRRAGYLTLEHDTFLELLGIRPSSRREALFARCRNQLPDEALRFWDEHPGEISRGPATTGRFEHYFELFRTRALPLVHSRRRVAALLEPRSRNERETFYEQQWDTLRWRLLFRVFFSRFVMGRLGRDPSFFKYVEGSVADRILQRARHALVELDPSSNPYLGWILNGTFHEALPLALRPGPFESIRDALQADRLSVHAAPLERVLEDVEDRFDAFNLSDIFEYMSEEATADLLERLARQSHPGARLAYWNMLAPRSRPERLASVLKPLEEEATRLFAQDQAFFYNRFVLEEVTG